MPEPRLPIGVVIPTLNARSLLPDHLAMMRTWAEWVQEIVVVDSHSTDGTIEYIQSQLSHSRLRILSHPRGLFQSWNFGVQQITAPYTYISTAGDSIGLAGLKHLLETAQTYESDVVLTPPIFQEPGGEVLKKKRWTIHHYLEAQGVRKAALLPKSHLFLTSVFGGASGLMGSSASNLYRTTTLKERPFPTNFAHVGDTAWGLANAFEICAAVSPEPCATFLIHHGAVEGSDAKRLELDARLLELARATLAESLRCRRLPPEAESFWQFLDRYNRLHQQAQQADLLYYSYRSKTLPWFLRFPAWKARQERNQHRAALQRLWRDALATYTF